MIITSCRTFDATDVAQFAWSRVAQFENVDAVTETIIKLHAVPKKHHNNARNQATHIRYCLRQAREYSDAAQTVSLATRPVLLYYCAMSLALCEILLKQSGDSRLEKLREHHNCHGLELIVNGAVSPREDLVTTASQLRARAQFGATGARGTFEVWRKSSREMPLGGELEQIGPAGRTTGYYAIMGSADSEPAPLPKAGLTLLDCLARLPGMDAFMREYERPLDLVRATVSQRLESGGPPVLTILVHPALEDRLERFSERLVQNA